MERIDPQSADLTARNVERIAELFPSVITETRGADGVVRRGIDFDLLRQELSDHVVDGPRERYQLDWPGKRQAMLAANAPIEKTLRPDRAESVDFDTTKNLFIEGDNLDALKLLQESYLSKIKLIYIDPPYNTGNDFIYRDDFAESTGEYLEKSGQVDEAGDRLVANTESNGRFHSDWLSMMYPRLKLARNLLRDDGVICISINDVEIGNLRELCDEIFGAGNFLAQFVWLNDGNVDQQSKIKGTHEYVLCFARHIELVARPRVIDPNIDESSKLYRDVIENSITKNGPANPPSTIQLPIGFPAAFERGYLQAQEIAFPHLLDEIVVEDHQLTQPARVRSGWSSRNLLELFIRNGGAPIVDSDGRETRFELRESGAIYGLKRRSEDQGHVISVLRNMGTTKKNSALLKKWGLDFSYPKPVLLVEYLISVFTAGSSQDVVLDFFSGSATTAHATLRANIRDGGDRRHIQVQIPEVALDAGQTIAELGRRRIRAASDDVSGAHRDKDLGFRTLRIDSSTLVGVRRAPGEQSQDQLDLEIESVKPERTSDDLVFQVLLDWGLELSLPIERGVAGTQEIFVIDNGPSGTGAAVVACFDERVTLDIVREIALLAPRRAVFRHSAFATDADRINTEQIFTEISPHTDVKTI